MNAYKQARIYGINSEDHFKAHRRAVLDRMERRCTDAKDMVKVMATEAIDGNNFSIKWTDMTNSMRYRMHELISAGIVKVYARKTGDYQTEYFAGLTKEGLVDVLTENL